MEFLYADNNPCMREDLPNDTVRDEIFYECVAIDEFHYDIYTYKRGSYGGETTNWASVVENVWLSLDLSKLSDDELIITYCIKSNLGLDDNVVYKYSRE